MSLDFYLMKYVLSPFLPSRLPLDPYDLVFVADLDGPGIFVAPADTFNFTRLPLLDDQLNTSQPVAVDYDPRYGMVYWTDVVQQTISRAGLDGGGQQVVVQNLGRKCRPLATGVILGTKILLERSEYMLCKRCNRACVSNQLFLVFSTAFAQVRLPSRKGEVPKGGHFSQPTESSVGSA